jgi:DNA polymerase elongation subunit (family B)
MKWFLDTECYPNYFLIVLKSLDGQILEFEYDHETSFDKAQLVNILSRDLTIGFNSRFYDIPMIMRFIKENDKPTNDQLKRLSDELILSDNSFNIISNNFLWTPRKWNHIDIIRVLPSKGSLKMYGARIHTRKLQDLPYDPSKVLTREEKNILKDYCINDVDITRDLYLQIQDELRIRHEVGISIYEKISIDLQKYYYDRFGVDIRSKSDADIVEICFKLKFNDVSIPKEQHLSFKYKPPHYISYYNENITNILKEITEFDFTDKTNLKKDVSFVGREIKTKTNSFTIGIGGLHSKEESLAVIKTDDEFLIDVDVTSYYPSIIINNGIYPSNIGKEFLYLYKLWRDRRLKIKDKTSTPSKFYKIVLNGTFGRFGYRKSILYDLEKMIQITITGQLCLLMLIEELEKHDFDIISGNTDGLTVRGKISNTDKFNEVLEKWEFLTGFELEKTHYDRIYIRDVNNYLAIKSDGGVKTKGFLSMNDLSRNAHLGIVKKAVKNYLTNEYPIENTIKNGVKEDYILTKKTKFGANFRGEYLGKVVRWYYRTDGDYIFNMKGHKVPDANNCYPIMNLDDEMVNIDYGRYYQETIKTLKTIGVSL